MSSPIEYDERVLPQQYLLHWLSFDVNRKLMSMYVQRYSSEVNMSPHEYLPWEDLLHESIQKITLFIQLAQDTQTTEVLLPEWCRDFADAFSEKTYEVLPPYLPYDETT